MSPFVYEFFIELAGALISSLFFVNLLQPKYSKSLQTILWCEVSFIVAFLTPYISYPRIVITAIAEIIYIFIMYKDKIHKKILFYILKKVLFFISLLTAIVIHDKFTMWGGLEYNYNDEYLLIHILLLSVFIFILLELIKIVVGYIKNKSKNIESIWLLLIQCATGIGICYFTHYIARRANEFNWYNETDYLIYLAAGIILVNISLGAFALHLLDKKPLENNLDYGKELSNMEYKYYEMSVENDKKLLAIRHDISNHIQTVYSLFESGDHQKGMELINELKEHYLQVDRMVYCNNPVVNIILSNKRSDAEKKGIEVHIKVKESLVDIPVSDFDLSTVICNLIDNAIRGCICSEQSHPRMIIEIMNKNNYLVIRILNSCKITMNIDGTDKIETTKSKSQTHGIGMPIIAGIAKKYRGDFVATARNGIFTATVVLSIK